MRIYKVQWLQRCTKIQAQQGQIFLQPTNQLVSMQALLLTIIIRMTLQSETADDFLKFSHKFKLGCLLTEQQNPHTMNLSTLAKQNLYEAIHKIKYLDIQTIKTLKSKIPQLFQMYKDINECLETNGRIFMCGCGATGRLSLVLQTLWRQQVSALYPDWVDRTVAFMAGGDAALIKSVQDFEDHPEFACQQLIELGFTENDMLIGSTEGGQTPWVIGAIWKSTQLSKRKPYILYGNTDELLVQNVERSRQFIESEKIKKINCNVGQMALAGSTRMQSTTILMHAIGIALLGCDKIRNIKYSKYKNWQQYAEDNVNNLLTYLEETDFSILSKLIERETNIYKNKEQITYITDPYYAISILTDTTERSPTFSLIPFFNKYTDQTNQCWCDLKIINQHNSNQEEWDAKVQSDWGVMLGGRKIRGLDSAYWSKYKQKVSAPIILGFEMHLCHKNTLKISHPLSFEYNEEKVIFPKFPLDCRLSHHSIIKMVLNNLSTIIMGRMDRYENNIMTYVKPTNYKLIDRATRYVIMLRPESKYEEVVRIIYKIRDTIKVDDPIVLKVIEELNKK